MYAAESRAKIRGRLHHRGVRDVLASCPDVAEATAILVILGVEPQLADSCKHVCSKRVDARVRTPW